MDLLAQLIILQEKKLRLRLTSMVLEMRILTMNLIIS